MDNKFDIFDVVEFTRNTTIIRTSVVSMERTLNDEWSYNLNGYPGAFTEGMLTGVPPKDSGFKGNHFK